MVYDISTTRTPAAPIGDYILQLPVYYNPLIAGAAGTPNAAAAQSEILALNDTQFLVLSRDSLGLGLTTGNSVFKSILLVDTTGATNIAGLASETAANGSVTTVGVLNSSITPVQQVEIVNMLNSTQLAKFGENLNNVAPTRLTLSEKWEGMALAPVLDENAPQDFFLFVGNDNDFLASNCSVNGQNCSQSVNSDAHVLIYRLTLPTYVDAQYLAAMNAGGPAMLEMMTQAALSVGAGNTGNILAQVGTERRQVHGGAARPTGINAWVQGTYNNDDWTRVADSTMSGKRDGFRGSFGFDYPLGESFVGGLAVGYGQQNGKLDNGLQLDADGYSFGGYLGMLRDNLYANIGFSFGQVDVDKMRRPGAYGTTALGKTSGNTKSYFAEAGYSAQFDGFRVGPKVGFYGDNVDLDAYTEAGAAGGNIAVPSQTLQSSVLGIGGEFQFTDMNSVMPFVHASYNWQLESKTRNVTLSLASAQNAMGTQTYAVRSMNEDYVEIGAGIQGTVGKAVWNLGYSAQLGMDDRLSHIIRAGVGFAF